MLSKIKLQATMFIMLKGFNWHKVTFNLCVVIFFRNSIRPTASHWRPSRHWNWKGICQKRPSHRSLMTCSVLFRIGKQKYLICKSLFTLWFYKMNHASLFRPRHTIMEGFYGFTLDVTVSASVCHTSIRPSIFSVQIISRVNISGFSQKLVCVLIL